MSKKKFLVRLIAVMCLIALFQLLVSEILVFQVIHPTFKDLITMLTLPGPVLVIFLSVFFLCVYFYIRKILRFLDLLSQGKGLEEKFVQSVQDRLVNFPYFMAVFAYPFWIGGAALATWIICQSLNWPMVFSLYGLFGGMISSLISTPVAIYGYAWVMTPVIEQSVNSVSGLEPARTAGVKISVMTKLTITVLSLIIAVSAYMGIVGYKQASNIFENMERMEELLPEPVKAGLLKKMEKTVEPRPKSSSYYHSQIGNLRIFYLSTMALAIIVSLILSIASAHFITSPLRVLRRSALQVKEGDYNQPVYVITNDELSEMASSFNQMMQTIVFNLMAMESVVEKLKNGLRQIDETVLTILAVSNQQAGGSVEQASSLQETSAIAQEIASTAKEIEERAKLMDNVASSTLESCQGGEEKLERSQQEFLSISSQMEAIQSAMAELGVRFKETYRIVDLIGDIAEKTEILSLNASIEAAGAGAEGRRFRVVADETRRQALRSAEAMKQIKDLVTIIQQATMESANVTKAGRDKVASGGRTIEEALSALKTISNFAESTLASSKEIAISTVQQTRASEQLATSVSEIYTLAKQIEKGSKEINSVITNLQHFAESLRKTIQEKS